jgi:predicted nucleic acid-binding protein
MKNVLLDSWAILAFLNREEPVAAHIRHLLHTAEEQQQPIYLSIINLGEVYYTIGRRRGLTFAGQILEQIRHMPVEIVPVDETLVLQAATYKMRHPISYADAFALATAIQQNATLLTGDPEFKPLQPLYEIELLER